MATRAAFLGLGAIGRPMAARMATRFDLTVWNRTAARAAEFAAAHPVRVAATPKDAVHGADVIVTCLPTSREVESLLDGPAGIEAGLGSGALFLDCTSGDAPTSRRLAARLAGAGVAFADCPVSGGPPGAEAGKLTVMVGAEPAVFARAEPVLQAFGSRIVHLGPVGSGDIVKAINQAFLAANILTLGEGLTAMVKAGVDARKGLDVINASSGGSFAGQSLLPDRVLTGRWPPLFRLALLDKDVGIAMDLIRELGLPAPVLDRVQTTLAEARRTLGEGADYLEPIKLNERAAGVEVRG